MDVRFIPGTAGFKASSCGVIFDPDGNIRRQYTNGDGYKTVSVKVEDGYWQTFGVHRLVARAHHHWVSPSHIFHAISRGDKKRLFKGRYLIVETGDEFPSLSQHEYEFLKSPLGKEVISYNETENKIVIWKSAAEFIRETKLSKKAVTVDLKNNKLRNNNGWWYLYHTPKNAHLVLAVMNRPGS